MRRFFAMLLALTMVLSLSATAFADEVSDSTAEGYVSASRTADITIKKLYNITGSENQGLYPQETLTFVSTGDSANPEDKNLTIAPLVVASNSNETLTITLPSYSKVGTYHYTITEVTPADKMQGVTYSDAEIAVTVLVTYNYDDECLDAEIVLGNGEAATGKVDTFTNQYDVGTLKLSKTVTGNLGDQSAYFAIDVTFTSAQKVASEIPVSGGSHESNDAAIAIGDWQKAEGSDVYTCTKTFMLKHSDTLTFSDIPTGVTYTVEEDSSHTVESDSPYENTDPDKGYTVTYSGKSGTIAAAGTAEAAVVNDKSTTVDTGILLDSMPYVLMFTAAAAGLIAIFGKKRYEI